MRSKRVHNYGDIVKDVDRYLMVIRPKHAASLFYDVQLYVKSRPYSVWQTLTTPEEYRILFNGHPFDYREFLSGLYAIEVDKPDDE